MVILLFIDVVCTYSVYKYFNKMNDNKFQELIRILDATLEKVNSSGLITGHNALLITEFLYNFPGTKNHLTKGLKNVVENTLQKKDKENVRREIKNVLLYPNQEYPPWKPIKVSNICVEELKKKLREQLFQIKLVDDKIYALCATCPNLCEVAFSLLRRYDSNILKNMIPNTENCHVTLANSDVVFSYGKERVKEYMKNNPFAFFQLNLSKNRESLIKSTVSNDWSAFSKCIVLSIHSEVISIFIAKFNEHFKTWLSPSLHITLAIKPRDLFYDTL